MPMSKEYRLLQVGGPRPVKAHRVKREEALRLPWSSSPFLLSAISAVRLIKQDIDEIVCMHIEDAFYR